MNDDVNGVNQLVKGSLQTNEFGGIILGQKITFVLCVTSFFVVICEYK